MAALSSTTGPYSISPVERIAISPPQAINAITTSSSSSSVETMREWVARHKRELEKRIIKCRDDLIKVIEQIPLAEEQRKNSTWIQKAWSWWYEGRKIDLPRNMQTETIKRMVEHAIGEKTEAIFRERNSSFFRWALLYLRDFVDNEMIPHQDSIRECIGKFKLQQKKINLINRHILLDKLLKLLGNDRITLDPSTILKIDEFFTLLWEKYIVQNLNPSAEQDLSDSLLSLLPSTAKTLSTAELSDLNNLMCDLNTQLELRTSLQDESREDFLKDSIIAQHALEMMDAIVYVADIVDDQVEDRRQGKPSRAQWEIICRYELERALFCIKTQSISQILKILARAHKDYLLNVHQNREEIYFQVMERMCRVITPWSAITEITEEDHYDGIIQFLFGWMIKSINLKRESFRHLSDPDSCDLSDTITSKVVQQILARPPVFDRPLLSLRRNTEKFETHLVIIDQMKMSCIAFTHKIQIGYFSRKETPSFNFYYGNRAPNNKVKVQENENIKPRHVPLFLMQFVQFAANINPNNYGKSKLKETILSKILSDPLVNIINEYLLDEEVFKLEPLFQSRY